MAEEDNPNFPKSKGSRRISPVDLDKIGQKLLNVLQREANILLDRSWREKLSADDSKSLVNYLKLLKEFQSFELEALESLTDEELAERAKTNQKSGE